MNAPTKEELSAHYLREFDAMPKHDFGVVLANITAVEAEERAKKLPIWEVISRMQDLFDAADGDSSEALSECLESLQKRAREIERIEGEALEAYEQSSLRTSSALRKI